MPALVEVGGAAPREFELGGFTRIGRDPASSIVLADPLVSLNHAEIHRTPEGRYQLADLGSRRGTYVGGRRVTKALLSDGDEILIGIYCLRFE